jgi:hypothetical protein
MVPRIPVGGQARLVVAQFNFLGDRLMNRPIQFGFGDLLVQRMANMRRMRVRRSWFGVIAGAALLSPITCDAAIVTLFNFNDMSTNNNGTTAATVDNAVGVPTIALVEENALLADLNGQVGVAFNDADGTAHSAGMAAAWTTGVLNTSTDPTDRWLLSLNTTGYSNLNLRFDYRLTSAVVSSEDLQGPTKLTVDWAVGGGAFTTIQTFDLMKTNSYNVFNLDLSGIAAIQNAADVQIRGTWSNDATEGVAGGTSPSVRMDNLQLTGIPEPASITLAAAAVALISLRRRKWARAIIREAA